jgi:DNA-binding NtrC family response regulator
MTAVAREKATILVADDDPDILRVTAAILHRFGYEVLTARSGEAALKAFEEAPHTIHLVISDVVMPGMKGPQLVHSIKSLSPSIATLLMSGTWGIVSDAGAASIAKPFQMPALVDTVKNLLARCDFATIELEQSVARSKRLAAKAAEKRDGVKPVNAHPHKGTHPL